MPTPDEHQALSRRRDELRQELAHVADLRQGSLSSRYRRCGKPRCHCAQEGDPGHGPYWSVTRAVHGKTQFRSIAPDAVRQTEEQIAEFHRFQRLTREFVDVSTRLCDAQLEAGAPGAPEKKVGLKRRSPRRSRKPPSRRCARCHRARRHGLRARRTSCRS